MHRSLVALSLGLLIVGGYAFAQKKPVTRHKPVTRQKAVQRKGVNLPRMSSGPRLTAVARSDQDSIVLRWAPSTPMAWLAGNKLGYIVERVTMLKNVKDARATFHRLTTSPLKPWSLDQWKARIVTSDRYQAIAVQALYGKTFVPSPHEGPTERMKEEVDELTNRFGFSLFVADMDPQAAAGLGLQLVDKDVQRGQTYSYRIFLAGTDSLVHLDTAFTVASASPFVQPPAPIDFTAEPGEHAVTLRWRAPADPRGSYTAFNIYRSNDDGKGYQKLNDLPFLTASGKARATDDQQVYTDTSAVDYVRYRYRVEGITPFADAGKAAEVGGMAVDLTPPPPPKIRKPVQLALGVMQLGWDMPATSPDFAGFVVSRSSFALKNYHLILRRGTLMPSPGKSAAEQTRELMKLILPADTRTFVDSTATSAEPYYVVAAVDTAGNLAQSLPAYGETMDTTRPSMPQGLAGTIDKNGYVHLHWHLGPEHNIIGYRVLWANEATHEFSQLVNEPLADTAFSDSVNLHTLSHYIYYRVAAVSDRYIQSPLSVVLELRRPDIVPPASPVFLDVKVTESSVLLRWAPSPSDDVAKQILSRRVQGNDHWREIESLGKAESRYVDTTVTDNVMYEYQIEAVDSSGLHSVPSPAVEARPYDTGIRLPVTDVTVRYDAKLKRVRLYWKYASHRKERYWFVIYRGEGQNPVMEYSSVAEREREFQDQRVQKSVSYKYAVRVKTDNGAESPLSETASVLIEGPATKEGLQRK